MNRPLINESLRIIRLYWGKTQSELADELGISQSYVSEIEKGKREVTLGILEKYSGALNVPLSTLMLFVEQVGDAPPVGRSKLFITEKALAFLRKLIPDDYEKTD